MPRPAPLPSGVDLITPHPADTIREALDTHGVKHTWFAARGGFTRKQVSNVLCRYSSLSIRMALACEEFLGLDAAELMVMQTRHDVERWRAGDLRSGGRQGRPS